MSVVIETTIGDITVDLYLKERPNSCLNFLKLCKIKYYNLCLFYKIEKNFIAQTGDPTATGRGGESIFCHLYGEQAKYFDAEFKPQLKHMKLGTLSMVNNGNDMNGSQFFITLSENLTYLDENHTVFGEVAEGFDILMKLNDAICDNNNRPYQDIRITHTVILHDPFEDPKGLQVPNTSPEPTREMLETNYIGADEEINDNKGKTSEEIEEKLKESEAKARATILEMVGDIPDADVKPPENVLFICKLNPITTSEDLEIIFSRFGKILSCEVIKDKKTGDSLQYAFIEFEKEEDCEAAYFKMDNVLIDDRRIHVDFSQSVSKMFYDKNKFKGPKQSLKSNIFLRKTERSDNYDLIFDIEDDSKNHKQKYRDLTSKHEISFQKKKHSREKSHKVKVVESNHVKNYKYHSKKDKRYKNEGSLFYSSSNSKNHASRSEIHRDSKSHRNLDYYERSTESSEHRSLQKKVHDSSCSHSSVLSQDRHIKLSSYDSHTSRPKSHSSTSPERMKRKQDRYQGRSQYNSHSSERNHSVSPDKQKNRHKDLHSFRMKCSLSPVEQTLMQGQYKQSSDLHMRKEYSYKRDSHNQNYMSKNKIHKSFDGNERQKSRKHTSDKRKKSKVSRSSSSDLES